MFLYRGNPCSCHGSQPVRWWQHRKSQTKTSSVPFPGPGAGVEVGSFCHLHERWGRERTVAVTSHGRMLFCSRRCELLIPAIADLRCRAPLHTVAAEVFILAGHCSEQGSSGKSRSDEWVILQALTLTEHRGGGKQEQRKPQSVPEVTSVAAEVFVLHLPLNKLSPSFPVSWNSHVRTVPR